MPSAGELPLRILHVVCDCVPSRHSGGISKAVLGLAVGQARLGHVVEIVTMRNEAGDPDREVVEDVVIRRLDPSPRLRGRYSHRVGAEMKSAHSAMDVVHVHNVFSPLNITGLRLAIHWDASLFVHVHGALDPDLFSGRDLKSIRKRLYIHLVEKRILRRARAVFALTDIEKSWLEELGVQSRIVVLPNGVDPSVEVDPDVLSAFRARFPSHGGPRLLYVGRFVAKKNIEAMIRALSSLTIAFPWIEFLLAGDRSEHRTYVAELDLLIRSLSLDENVIWVGFLDEAIKPAAYSVADAFVHASHSEGFPMAVIEAMAAGLPCVVTPGTMMGEVARSGAIRECNEAQLAATLGSILADQAYSKQLGDAARDFVTSHLSWERIASESITTYTQGQL